MITAFVILENLKADILRVLIVAKRISVNSYNIIREFASRVWFRLSSVSRQKSAFVLIFVYSYKHHTCRFDITINLESSHHCSIVRLLLRSMNSDLTL
jgi:hypothetical protein